MLRERERDIYDEVVASSRFQESLRSACAGVTPLIDPECFIRERERFIGIHTL